MPRRCRHLIFLSLFVFSLIALGSPILSQVQSQLPYWTEAAQPTVAWQELYPEVLNNKIYVVGGVLSPATGFSAHFEFYDPVNNAWTVLRPLPEARHHITLSFAPAIPSAMAVALPIPDVPPVTKATSFSSILIAVHFLVVAENHHSGIRHTSAVQNDA